jgi:hypothetical protein
MQPDRNMGKDKEDRQQEFCCWFVFIFNIPLPVTFIMHLSLKKYIVYIIFLLCGLQQVSAQEILVQWTGVVRNDLLEPVPFAHVLVKKDLRGVVSDPQGMFTIITFPNDTLFVSCVGYKVRKIVVPDVSNTGSKHYVKDIIMETDTIMLGEAVIFPWRTYTEFKEAFLSLHLEEDDMQRAYQNIAAMQEQMVYALANRSASPTTSFRDVMAGRTDRMMTYGHMYPTYSITNPMAWVHFFRAIRNGEFKKKEDSERRMESAWDENTNKN